MVSVLLDHQFTVSTNLYDNSSYVDSSKRLLERLQPRFPF